MKPSAPVKLPPLEGIGPLGNPGNAFGNPANPNPSLVRFESTLSTTIGVLTISAGIWFIFQIFIGAYQWLVSSGEKQALQNAQKKLTNAIVGLFIVVFAYILIGVVSKIFGINILAPACLILQIVGGAPPASNTLCP